MREKGGRKWGPKKHLENSYFGTPLIFRYSLSGQVRPRQGTEICNFGAPSPLEALHWIFCFFSSFYVQFSKTNPLKSGESSEKSSGENGVKSCHVCGCHGFFGPDFSGLPKISSHCANFGADGKVQVLRNEKQTAQRGSFGQRKPRTTRGHS